LPANVEIYLSELRSTVNFEALKLDNLLRFANLDISAETLQSKFTQNISSSGFESGDGFFILLAKQYGLVLLVFMINCLIIGLILMIPKVKALIKTKVIDFVR